MASLDGVPKLILIFVVYLELSVREINRRPVDSIEDDVITPLLRKRAELSRPSNSEPRCCPPVTLRRGVAGAQQIAPTRRQVALNPGSASNQDEEFVSCTGR